MDKIEELIAHFARTVEAEAADDYWTLPRNREQARAALRAEYERLIKQNEKMKDNLEKILGFSSQAVVINYAMVGLGVSMQRCKKCNERLKTVKEESDGLCDFCNDEKINGMEVQE